MQFLMVRHAAPAEIIGAAKAAPAAPVSTPMQGVIVWLYHKQAWNNCFITQPIWWNT